MQKVKIDFPTSGQVVVKDGDTVAVFAKTGITAFDPADEYPYVVQVYYGGHEYPISSATAATLTAYTAHGTGYGDCITS